MQLMLIYIGCSYFCIQCYRKEINQQMVPQIVLIFTRRIEHHHLTLRSRIKRLDRKTIYFSRAVEIHEKIIGSFIEKHMF
ncbi:IS1 transposase family protein [Shigella flexneri 2a str. 2457T]|nr:IS1 transposase family protein [Shigella flexneri 2a str. 2457T]